MKFEGLLEKSNYTKLFYLRNERLGKNLLAIYVGKACIFVNCEDNEIVGNIKFK